MAIDEMLSGLDVEELVDELTRGDSRMRDEDQAASRQPSGLDRARGGSKGVPGRSESPVSLIGGPASGGAGGASSGRTARRGGRGNPGSGFAVHEEEDGQGPKSGVWGVDDRLTVQGPPPQVVAVEGFDEPMTDFASGGRRGSGRRRPRPGDEIARDHAEDFVVGFGGGGEPNAVSAINDDFGTSGDNWGPQALPAEAPPQQRSLHPAPSAGTWGLHEDSPTPEPAQAQAKGGRRWWKPWQGGGPGDGGGKQRGPGEPGQTEVTQVSAFSFDD